MSNLDLTFEVVEDESEVPASARRGRERAPSPFDDILHRSFVEGKWFSVPINTELAMKDAMRELTRAKTHLGIGLDTRIDENEFVNDEGITEKTFRLYFRGREAQKRARKAKDADADADASADTGAEMASDGLTADEAAEVQASDAMDVEDVKAVEKVKRAGRRKATDADAVYDEWNAGVDVAV